MKLRTKYILFVVILHLVALTLSWFIFAQNRIYFIISEVFIIISVIIAWQLYLQLLRPLKTLMQGVEAIKDRDFNVKFLSTGKHEMDQLIEVYNQMMDELRTERTRQEQQHFFLEKLIFTSPTGIIILDYDDNVQQINPKALQIIGVSADDVLKYPVDKLRHPLLLQIKRLNSGEAMVVKPDGINTYKLQKSHFIDRGFSRHFIMIEDLTTEILAAEKNVYGKVIRMMAHEVNNTIGPVNSIMQSTLKTHQLWEGNKNDTLKDALQVAIDRNQNLNHFMRGFADLVKLPAANKKPLDLHQLIGSVTRLMAIKAGEKLVEFEFRLTEGPFMINADAQQMEQVLINIVKNAIEAINEKGKISFISLPANRSLVIADTGAGIDGQHASDLFSPFFSTKKDGQGIGLTLVREILINHNFDFSLKTVAEHQTEFSIIFN
ncbi:sensor histidine kinase [Mucilaginibacter gotjawali]|uniref:Nitrogen fixation/metabolism regulation signal transduction histidine kinase n=2 Tax=Mucilaginibacter gotjawali TaxID=1550579 RepID=A0A839SGJ2_9SPHI|nr:ATP-binding protein [Mucilaginibacter gotjawali]MBB3056404.1 nitrogen fixation/metabolism regulation signal transduction histidine kinase [Mucilaginibacter gotjawali]BAU55110.1 Sensor protein FixL [Mucilaginibacter gotjawali]